MNAPVVNKKHNNTKPKSNPDAKDKKKPKERPKKRTIFTLVAMINLMWYTIAVLIANFLDHTVQAELTVAWFSAWTVELALLFGIRISSKSEQESSSQDSKTNSDTTTDDDETIIIDDESSDSGVG